MVDTCTTGIPRCHDAAAKPATSVTIPPPTPTTTSLRVSPIRANERISASIVASDLADSPSPISNTSTVEVGQVGADLAKLDRDPGLGHHRDPPGGGGDEVGQFGDRAVADDDVVRRDRRAGRSPGASQHRPGDVVDRSVVDRDDRVGDVLVQIGSLRVHRTQRAFGVVVEQRSMHPVAHPIERAGRRRRAARRRARGRP